MQELDFDDIYGALPGSWLNGPYVWLMAVFGVALLASVLFAIRFFLKRRVRVSCPYRVLIDALENLQRDSSLILHDRAARLSLFLRNFVAETVQSGCQSCTDDEIVILIGQSSYGAGLKNALQELFSQIVNPKFSPTKNSDFYDGDLCVERLIEELHLEIEKMKEKK